MSTQKTLDQMLAEIDELVNEETAPTDPGTIVAVPAGPESPGRALAQMVQGPELPSGFYRRLPSLGTLPRCHNPIIRIVMTHANHPYIRIQDSANRLGITVEEVRMIRNSRQYLQVVKDRINRNDREGLYIRMLKWVTPIDRIYARYFGVPIADIRNILEEIFPGWSEVYNDSWEVRRQAYQVWLDLEHGNE